jgi:hypothetical protein
MSRVQIRRSGRMFLSLALLFGLIAGVGSGPPAAPAGSAERLVAIGDIHGDFNDFIAILQRVGLIDKQNHWAGGKATLIQVGDLLDRGPQPRQVLDLMMSLEPEAEKAGGR